MTTPTPPKFPAVDPTTNRLRESHAPEYLTREQVGAWTPGMPVEVGQRIISPTGENVVAVEDTTLGQAYDASKFQGISPTVYTLDMYEWQADASKKVLFQQSPDILYATTQNAASTVYKTTDGGVTWQAKGDIGMAVWNLHRVAGSGTLIATEDTPTTNLDNPARVRRSTDDGVTWTDATTLKARGLGSQSILSPAPNVILIAEYGNVANKIYSVRRSTDDGVTWTNVLSSSGTDPVYDPGHIHSVVQDPYNGAILAFMDRPQPQVWVSHDAGATWVLLGTSTTTHHPNWVAPMFFRDYIAWGNDNEAEGRVYRLPREDFYAGQWNSPETVAKLGNGRFYDSFPIQSGVWLMVGAVEPVNKQRVGSYNPRLYIVSHEGASVAGGLIASVPLPVLSGGSLGAKFRLPGYPATTLDMEGRTWINYPTQGLPGTSTMVAASLSRDPVFPRNPSGALSAFIVPADGGLKFNVPGGTAPTVLNHSSGGQTLLSNGKGTYHAITATHIHQFRVENNIRAEVTSAGMLLHNSPLFFNTAANSASIQAGFGNPNGVVTARRGSIYVDQSTISVWQRIVGSDMYASDGWEVISGRIESLSALHLANPSHVINTYGKYAGKSVWSSTDTRMVYAHGPGPTDPWGDGQGNIVYTPV